MSKLGRYKELPLYQQVLIGLLAVAMVFTIVEVAAYGYLWFASVKEGLSVHLDSPEETLTLMHGEKSDLEFSLSVQNAPFCKATCEWSVLDVRSNERIEHGNETMRTGMPRSIQASIRAPTKGRGVAPYQLQAVCRNEPTYRCQRNADVREAAQTVLVEITLTEREQAALEDLQRLYPDWLSDHENRTQLLLGIADITDGRLDDLRARAREQADRITARNARLGRALSDEDYIAALMVVDERVESPAIEQYRELEALEERLVQGFGQNQTVLNAYRLAMNQTAYEELRAAVRAVHDASLLFHIQPLNRTQQALERLSAVPEPDIHRAAINSSLEVHQTILEACTQADAACPAPPPSPDSTVQAIELLEDTCQQVEDLNQTLQDYNATNITISPQIPIIEQRCERATLPTITPPQAVLPAEPREPMELAIHEQPPPVCCGASSCGACERDSLPVLFVHGHSFAESATPEYSLQAFTDMAFEMQSDGRLYLGRVFPGDTGEGAAEHIPGGVSATTTYYYDTYAEEGVRQFAIRKSEPIESYSIRLKEAVDSLKAKTGSEEVVIVAHSMGGLVTRRYMQIFGEQSVAGLVMIGTPNEGISGQTGRLCPLVGGDRECEDMRAGSLFMRKLNSGPEPSVPALTIAGVGCDGREWDGVIQEDSVRVDWAEHVRIQGDCPSAQENLHGSLLHPQEYPEVYDAVLDFVSQVS